MSHKRSYSAHALHNSVFERTQAKNALRLRDRFENDELAPNEDSAIMLAENYYTLYMAARLDHAYRYCANSKLKRKKRYRDRPAERREVSPAAMPAPTQMSKAQLAYYKLCRPDWEFSESKPVTGAGVAAGMAEVQAEITDLLQDGRLPEQRRCIPLIEKHLDVDHSQNVERETLDVFRSLSPEKRFSTLDAFHNVKRAANPRGKRISPFLSQQRAWRGKQSEHACLILSQFKRDLQKFSAVDLQAVEARYRVHALSPFPKLRHVGTRTARIAIAMVACGSEKGTSRNLALDANLAFAVATKLDAFFAKSTPKRLPK